jgi:hypothetical protein
LRYLAQKGRKFAMRICRANFESEGIKAMTETSIPEPSSKIRVQDECWENADNSLFYENISIEVNIQNSVLAGLEKGAR